MHERNYFFGSVSVHLFTSFEFRQHRIKVDCFHMAHMSDCKVLRSNPCVQVLRCVYLFIEITA